MLDGPVVEYNWVLPGNKLIRGAAALKVWISKDIFSL